jgi:hypothetical protein
MTNPPQEDTYDLPALDVALAGTPFAGNIRYFPSIHSTNVLAMREADEGAPEGMVYLADEQTAGRGRGAHGWHSARGAGLYVSVLLRPRVAPADILWLSLAAGLAVRNAVRQVTSLEADIRWPNDLLLGRKKFCGILTELNAEVTRVRHAVVGIGVNVHQESFPSELAHRNRERLAAAGSADRFVTIALPGSASAQCGDRRRGLQHPQPHRRRFYLDSRQASACGRGPWLLRRDGGPGSTRLSSGPHTPGPSHRALRWRSG